MYKEQKELHGGKFYVNAMSSSGGEVKLEVHSEMKIEQLKDLAVKKLDVGGIDSSSFHIIKVNNGTKKLSNLQTIKTEGLSSNDCVLLYPVRQEVNAKSTSQTTEAPSMSQIRKVTASLPSNEASKEPKGNVTSPTSTSAPLEQIFRKILLTLLDLSYQLMFFDEEAEEIFKKKFEVEVDEGLINQLTSMGFSKKRAKEALILNDMDVQMSMEWMLKHGEPMSDDEEEDDQKEAASKRTVEDIHKRLNRWKKRNNSTKTNSVHVSSLMDMGFSKEECMQALTYNGNNLQAACNWLLGERVVPEEDPNDTLDPDSDLFKAIVNNPTIHVGLHNKRVLEALEDMLENPQRRHNWANDPTVGSVILHILKLFHKYSTAVS